MLKRGVKHLSRVSDVFFRKLRIERDITIFPDDVFLTSYPRSGNTPGRPVPGPPSTSATLGVVVMIELSEVVSISW